MLQTGSEWFGHHRAITDTATASPMDLAGLVLYIACLVTSVVLLVIGIAISADERIVQEKGDESS
jgi:hypothetical protein